MIVSFQKYQGAGNDFVIIDNRTNSVTASKEQIAIKLCDRKFGIGSDGLIFIENTDKADFVVDFLNPDGSRSFCGNGSRCAVQFCIDNKIFIGNKTSFLGIDGVHLAVVKENSVNVEMKNVDHVERIKADFFAETGSPHYVSYFKSIDDLDMIEYGKQIRYSDSYKEVGTNVNAVQELSPNHIKVRTYERGVENETLACGTGVTACALSYAILNNLEKDIVNIDAVGGKLKVSFVKEKDDSFTNIWLEGPAEFVFNGEVNV
jgi:diaminopimelate epimerase